MTGRFVRFPGTPGNYLSTPDVNLLDADTAHLVQGLGTWISNATLDTDPGWWAPAFAQSFRLVGNGVSTGPGVPYPPVVAGMQYTFSAYLKSKVPGQPTLARIKVSTFEDSAGGVIDNPAGPYVETTDDWVLYEVQFTPTGLANSARVQVEPGSNGNEMLASAICLREGSDPTFVPSLRIMGVRDTRYRVSPTTWFGVLQVVGSQQDIAPDTGWAMHHRVGGLMRMQEFTGDGSTSFAWTTTDVSSFVSDGVASDVRWVTDPTATAELFINSISRFTNSLAANTYTQPNIPLILGGYDAGVGVEYAGDWLSFERRDGEDGPVVAQFDPDDIVLP